MKQDADGVYYWTVNGNYLTDASGNKMPVTGPKGEKGDKGEKGEKGEKGNTGDTGQKGVKGDAGTPGEKGEKGETGDKGEKGDAGEKGEKGETGDKGDTGEKRDAGNKGESGSDGNHAIAPQLRISDDNVWQISTDEGKTWKNMTDSHGNPVKATGAQGEKGEKGEKGAQGETGAAGKDGKNGKDGKDGDSFFKNVDVQTDCVVFTLSSDGSTFTLPRGNGIGIKFANDDVLETDVNGDLTTTVTLTGLSADNYKFCYAEIKPVDDTSASILTRATTSNVKLSNLADDYSSAQITISSVYADAVLRVAVVTKDNKETASSIQVKSKVKVYTIKSVNDWNEMAKNYKFRYISQQESESYLPIINLEADIDFKNATIQPLGMDVNSGYARLFQGIFNGNGHTIKNFKIDQKDEKGAGLFGKVRHPFNNVVDKKSTISNLIIENADITGIGEVGIVTGSLDGNLSNVTIRNSKATVLKGKNDMCLGCICGAADFISISDRKTHDSYEVKPEIDNCSFEDCSLSYNSDDLNSLNNSGGHIGVGKIYGYRNHGITVRNTSDAGVTINDTKANTAKRHYRPEFGIRKNVLKIGNLA